MFWADPQSAIRLSEDQGDQGEIKRDRVVDSEA